MKTLGEKIAENRKRKGLTQEELANQLGVSSQAVSKWENDLSIPDLPILIELADLYQMTLDELIREKENTEVRVVEAAVRKPIEQLTLRIIVDDDGDHVRINLPMTLVKVGMQMGMNMPQVQGKDVLQGIDLEQVLGLVEQGLMGKLLEVDSSDGAHVEISVE